MSKKVSNTILSKDGALSINLDIFSALYKQFGTMVRLANKIVNDVNKRSAKDQLAYITTLSKASGLLSSIIKECELLNSDINTAILSAQNPVKLSDTIKMMMQSLQSGQPESGTTKSASSSSLITDLTIPTKGPTKLKN